MRTLWSLMIACVVCAGGPSPAAADRPDQPALHAQSHALAPSGIRHAAPRDLPVVTIASAISWQPPVTQIISERAWAPLQVFTRVVATRSSRGPPIG